MHRIKVIPIVQIQQTEPQNSSKGPTNQKLYAIFHQSSLSGNFDYAIRLLGIASEVAAIQLLVIVACVSVSRCGHLLVENLRKDSAL